MPAGPYYALVEKEPASDFGVFFPDLPGCISAGKTLDQAQQGASEALSLHLEGMMLDGDSVPPPRSLASIEADPEYAKDMSGIVAVLRVLPQITEVAA